MNNKNRFTGFLSRQRYRKPNRGASAFNTPASDWKEDDTTAIYQGLWNSVLSSHAFLDARVSYNNLFFPLYLKSTDVSVFDLNTNIRSGSNTNEFHFTRRRLQANANLSYYVDNLAGARHEFRFGIDFAHAPTESDNLRNGDVNLQTRGGVPAFVTEYNTPVQSLSTVDTTAVFGQDSVSFGRVTINGGLRYQRTNGYLPDQSSPAGTFVPRAHLQRRRQRDPLEHRVAARRRRSSTRRATARGAIKASAARYYYTISTGDPNIVNLNGLSFSTYNWVDRNGDGKFQPGEEGTLLSRGGANISSIDPSLKQPHTDEAILSLEREVIPDLRLSVTGTWHRERNLYGAINTGVPTSAFSPVSVTDPGPDGVVGTADDASVTAYNQNPSTFGQDHLFYTNSSRARSGLQRASRSSRTSGSRTSG